MVSDEGADGLRPAGPAQVPLTHRVVVDPVAGQFDQVSRGLFQVGLRVVQARAQVVQVPLEDLQIALNLGEYFLGGEVQSQLGPQTLLQNFALIHTSLDQGIVHRQLGQEASVLSVDLLWKRAKS